MNSPRGKSIINWVINKTLFFYCTRWQAASAYDIYFYVAGLKRLLAFPSARNPLVERFAFEFRLNK